MNNISQGPPRGPNFSQQNQAGMPRSNAKYRPQMERVPLPQAPEAGTSQHLRDEVVAALATTANGCLRELGYTNLVSQCENLQNVLVHWQREHGEISSAYKELQKDYQTLRNELLRPEQEIRRENERMRVLLQESYLYIQRLKEALPATRVHLSDAVNQQGAAGQAPTRLQNVQRAPGPMSAPPTAGPSAARMHPSAVAHAQQMPQPHHPSVVQNGRGRPPSSSSQSSSHSHVYTPQVNQQHQNQFGSSIPAGRIIPQQYNAQAVQPSNLVRVDQNLWNQMTPELQQAIIQQSIVQNQQPTGHAMTPQQLQQLQQSHMAVGGWQSSRTSSQNSTPATTPSAVPQASQSLNARVPRPPLPTQTMIQPYSVAGPSTTNPSATLQQMAQAQNAYRIEQNYNVSRPPNLSSQPSYPPGVRPMQPGNAHSASDVRPSVSAVRPASNPYPQFSPTGQYHAQSMPSSPFSQYPPPANQRAASAGHTPLQPQDILPMSVALKRKRDDDVSAHNSHAANGSSSFNPAKRIIIAAPVNEQSSVSAGTSSFPVAPSPFSFKAADAHSSPSIPNKRSRVPPSSSPVAPSPFSYSAPVVDSSTSIPNEHSRVPASSSLVAPSPFSYNAPVVNNSTSITEDQPRVSASTSSSPVAPSPFSYNAAATHSSALSSPKQNWISDIAPDNVESATSPLVTTSPASQMESSASKPFASPPSAVQPLSANTQLIQSLHLPSPSTPLPTPFPTTSPSFPPQPIDAEAAEVKITKPATPKPSITKVDANDNLEAGSSTPHEAVTPAVEDANKTADLLSDPLMVYDSAGNHDPGIVADLEAEDAKSLIASVSRSLNMDNVVDGSVNSSATVIPSENNGGDGNVEGTVTAASPEQAPALVEEEEFDELAALNPAERYVLGILFKDFEVDDERHCILCSHRAHKNKLGQEPLFSDYSLKELLLHAQNHHSDSYEQLINAYNVKEEEL